MPKPFSQKSNNTILPIIEGIRGPNTFPKGISPKVNVIVDRSSNSLTFKSAVQYVTIRIYIYISSKNVFLQ